MEFRRAFVPVLLGLIWSIAAPLPPAGASESDSAAPLDDAGSGNPSVAWYRFLPTVIRSDRSTPVTLTMKITGGVPDKVALSFTDATELALHDDGLNGDAAAGDGIYSAQVAAAKLTSPLNASDVFRRFIGYGDIYLGSVRQMRVNVFAQIWTPEIGFVPTITADSQTQYSNYLLNLIDTATFAAGPNADMRPPAQRLYQRFADKFDFIDFVFDTSIIDNRFHFGIRNSIGGLGLPLFDTGAQYGSAKRLLGGTVFPNNGYFDGASTAHSHEIGHQWINFLTVPELAPGVPHWPASTLASGTMGMSIPGSGAGGDYNCAFTPIASGLQTASVNWPRTFTDLDLYLMGMIPSSSVATNYVFANQSAAPSVPCSGILPYSMFSAVSAGDVIAYAGTRSPAYPNAQRDFAVAAIVISDRLLSPEAMAYYDWFARRAEARTTQTVHEGLISVQNQPFYLQTGGRGTLTSMLTDQNLGSGQQNYSDSWWNANESGWGITITDHNSNMFVQWYTYDQSGHNLKYVIPGGSLSADKCVFSGALQRVTGPSWTLPAFDSQQVVRTNAGNAVINFCPSGGPAGLLTFSYTADGVSASKQLTRLAFGNDVPHWGGTANTGGPDFTDLWWNPNESGWGVSLTQHGNNVFARVFVYDTDGRPLLFIVPGVSFSNASNFSGSVQLTTGPWFGNPVFDPAKVVRSTAGSASFSFSDANNGVLTYTVNGITKSKAITRLSF